jgi:hypothetical protein
MGSLTSYKTKLTVVLKHEYYLGNSCPVMLCPDAATVRIFNRYGILFRPQGANQWQLLVRDGFRTEDLAAEETRFHFNLLVRDELVYYVSQDMKSSVVIDIRTAGEQFDLHIPAVEKQLEYICIPKYIGADVPVKMKEEKGRIRLKAAERVSLPGVPAAWRFVSEEKIRLEQRNPLKMQLWEIRENGERMISGEISPPRPNRFSPVSPKDMVTTFFYY